MFGYNQHVSSNSSKTHSTLEKKSLSIACHFVCEGVVKNEWKMTYLETQSNPAEFCTKSLPGGDKRTWFTGYFLHYLNWAFCDGVRKSWNEFVEPFHLIILPSMRWGGFFLWPPINHVDISIIFESCSFREVVNDSPSDRPKLWAIYLEESVYVIDPTWWHLRLLWQYLTTGQTTVLFVTRVILLCLSLTTCQPFNL